MPEMQEVPEVPKEAKEMELNSGTEEIFPIEELIPGSDQTEVIQMIPITENFTDEQIMEPIRDQNSGIGNLDDVISSVTKNSPKEKPTVFAILQIPTDGKSSLSERINSWKPVYERLIPRTSII